ncbi:MAG: hypothetical protein ACFE9L_07045 [Candidatus Hodarchaeota archaeon]
MNWKDHLVSLYFIRQIDGICLFSHHFQLGYETTIDNQLVGWGFSAFYEMIKEIVDSSADLKLLDVGKKKILIEKGSNILVVLITTTYTPFYRRKLDRITDFFEKIFSLQLQINSEILVHQEDYALTGDLIRFVFNDQTTCMLKIVPIIFKSIQQSSIQMSKKPRLGPNIIAKTPFSLKRKKNRI